MWINILHAVNNNVNTRTWQKYQKQVKAERNHRNKPVLNKKYEKKTIMFHWTLASDTCSKIYIVHMCIYVYFLAHLINLHNITKEGIRYLHRISYLESQQYFSQGFQMASRLTIVCKIFLQGVEAGSNRFLVSRHETYWNNRLNLTL